MEQEETTVCPVCGGSNIYESGEYLGCADCHALRPQSPGYFDDEDDDESGPVCPQCGRYEAYPGTNEFGDEVLVCPDCGYSWHEATEAQP